MLGPHLKPRICLTSFLSFPFPVLLPPNSLTGVSWEHQLNKGFGHECSSQGLPLERTQGLQSGDLHQLRQDVRVQEPMGQQVSRDLGWDLRTAGGSPANQLQSARPTFKKPDDNITRQIRTFLTPSLFSPHVILTQRSTSLEGSEIAVLSGKRELSPFPKPAACLQRSLLQKGWRQTTQQNTKDWTFQFPNLGSVLYLEVTIELSLPSVDR